MYNVGYVVKIKKWKDDKTPRHVVSGMTKYFGKNMVVREVINLADMCVYNLEDCTSINGSYWNWKEDDFEDKIQIKKFTEKEFEL